MNHRRFRAAVLAATLLSGIALDAVAGKFNRKLDIGDSAPRFQGLAGVDGKQHGLDDYKDAKLLVLCFTCNHCPVASAYEERFIEFAKRYREAGVAFVAVSVSVFPPDRLEKMKERAAKSGFNFDYLADETQETGRAYGATVTPHLFVLDKQRKVAYMGAFDDSMHATKVKYHYVRDAVDALLAGKTPEVTESLQRGCEIEYEAE